MGTPCRTGPAPAYDEHGAGAARGLLPAVGSSGSGRLDQQGRRPGPVLLEVVDDRGVVTVLVAIPRVDRSEVPGVRDLAERHLEGLAAGDDLAGARGGRCTEPARTATVRRADEDPLADTDDPDGRRPAQGPVGTTGHDTHLLRGGDRRCLGRP